MNKLNVLVTGASGFIGKELVATLIREPSYNVIALYRNGDNESPSCCTKVYKDLTSGYDLKKELTHVDIVIHTAARVHIMDDKAANTLDEFRKINVASTLYLAHQAIAMGAKRFIFISSIKVNGEETGQGNSYSADDIPAPTDPYGISKMEAEHELKKLSKQTGLDVVIIRPVLVYGPGVKANFLNMMRWLDKRIPLPLGAIENRRSLVALDNLVDMIVVCISHPAAANETFLVSDGEDLSTAELLRRLGNALQRPARLLKVSPLLLKILATILGRKDIADRLLGSLVVDLNKTRQLLGWSPPVDVNDALLKTVKYFQKDYK